MVDRWLLIEDDKGYIEIQRNRRAHSTHPDLRSAQQAISGEVGLRDRVIHEAPDGYRQSIGRQTRPRRGWRK